jgi:DNA-binding LacI/PurR family transcriptional regulator
MALGTMHAIRHRGLQIPDDIAVVGFDDLPLAASTTPPLTTVRQPLDEMSVHAVRLLIEQIGGDAPVASVRLMPHLVIRESCRGGAATNTSAKGGPVLA